MRELEKMVEGVRALASPPRVYLDLVHVVTRPTSRASDIAEVISQDPGLSASLLRLVNSSFFAFRHRIDSLATAVTAVGVSQIRDLALATSVISAFEGIPPGDLDMDRFWRHSLACGVGARVLASMRREYNVEAYFLGGLLHDLGRLVMLLEGRGTMGRALALARERSIPLRRAEREVFGFDHGDVGRLLVARWNLGPVLEEVVAFHHEPGGAEHFPLETATVHVADIMAGLAGWGDSGSPVTPRLSGEAWRLVKVSESQIPSLLNMVARHWEDAVQGIFAGRAQA